MEIERLTYQLLCNLNMTPQVNYVHTYSFTITQMLQNSLAVADKDPF